MFGGELLKLSDLNVQISLSVFDSGTKSSYLAVYSVKRQKLVSKTHRDLQLIVLKSSTLPDGFAPVSN
ncbi:MAG: hypothetical protein CMJ53_04750 [Planctomycetaceae bacterium]|nr:hypothetical protein [Planctomycetaceae bacterium]